MSLMDPMTDDDFKASGNKYFEAGVHRVFLAEPKRDTSKSGSDFIQFTAFDPDTDAKADVRLYLTEKAAPYTRKTLAGIAVHDVESDAQKEKVREAFRKITNTDQFDEKFLAKFENMQAWILAEEDLTAPKPNGGYYLRYNLYSYEPKPKKLTPEDIMGGGTKVDLSDDAVPFA